jgi:hypothetical protein
MSPQLHRWIYGFHVYRFHMSVRLGGYRSGVFIGHGIEMGIFLGSAAIAAVLAWRSKMIRHISVMPMGAVVVTLMIALFFSRAINGWVLLPLMLACLYGLKWARLRVIMAIFILLPAIYIGARCAGVIPYAFTRFVAQYEPDRAKSLQSRFSLEHVFAQHALKRPLFGWGTYNRNRPLLQREDMPEGAMGTWATDSLWIILIGQKGFFGLLSMGAIFVLPLILLAWRVPARLWLHPLIVGTTIIAFIAYGVLLNMLYAAFASPFYFVMIGGAASCLTLIARQLRPTRSVQVAAGDRARARATQRAVPAANVLQSTTDGVAHGRRA